VTEGRRDDSRKEAWLVAKIPHYIRSQGHDHHVIGSITWRKEGGKGGRGYQERRDIKEGRKEGRISRKEGREGGREEEGRISRKEERLEGYQ
jgi:hypothetical protein